MEFETRTNPEGIMVTVVCITYNHEQYIAEALDSFVRQKTNFKFKVFVGEDCGPDKTAEVVKEYAEKYPDIIVPFLREQNMGAQRNLIDLCQRAESPYIAFCEGDDYWIDDYKLQKQFDYMEANPELRFCFSRTEILAPMDWHLRGSYFKENEEGKIIFPDALPNYKIPNRFMRASDCIAVFPAHTSTHFYRWNYKIELPAWFFEGVEGAGPLMLIQVGKGKIGFVPDITSVYRRSDVGAIMHSNTTEHFLKTRMDYIRFLWGLREYFVKNYDGYCQIAFENRIKAEGYNFLTNAIKCEDQEAIREFFTRYPEASRIALNAYLSFYNDSRQLTNTCTWEGYKLVVRNRYYRNGLRPYIKLIKFIEKVKKRKKMLLGKCKNLLSLICYWYYSFVPKQKNLWVITSFRGKGYLDNSKYLYEHIVENHPEIDIYWLTRDEAVYEKLKQENRPVCKFGSKECRKILSHAQIAITDHFIMSDYDNLSGFNNKIKVVQLWHGVGFKSMGDGKTIKNTKEPGVQYSDDILPKENDSITTKIIKNIKYVRHAYYRELFEEYFILVCPGQERVEMIGDMWNVPKENMFMCGHPRNTLMHKTQIDFTQPKILYAPTYRFNANKEMEMVNNCIEAFGKIQALMEMYDGQFVVRLHPHTWRNYKTKILAALDSYDRIFLDEEKDIYTKLGEYSMIISDYSSIALDVAMLNRPTIFYCEDYEWFKENEAGFNLDFENSIPGPMTFTWEDTLRKVEEYIQNPDKDSELRKEKCKYFFDPDVNDENNSERIVQEIKRRLDLD